MSICWMDYDPIRGSRTEEKPYFDDEAIVQRLAQHLEECGVTPAEILNYSGQDWDSKLEDISVYGHPGITTMQHLRIASLVFQAIVRERMAEIKAEQREEQAWEDMQEYGGNRCPERE